MEKKTAETIEASSRMISDESNENHDGKYWK